MRESTQDQRVRDMMSTDLELVLSWRNHRDVRRYMYTQHEISIEEHRGWFERSSNDPFKHQLIFESHGVPLGFINIVVKEQGGIADWGFYAAPVAPKGTGRKLGSTVLNYCFDKLMLHKVCGQALSFNERSIIFHKSMGFLQEGVLRDQHYDGENYHAVICFGLLSHEWNSYR
ncbi:hypothetical protein D3C77_180590 [compost metagenome]